MRRWIYIPLFLCACQGEQWQPKEENARALFGIVESGQAPRLQVVSWEDDSAQNTNHLTWIWPDGLEEEFAAAGEYYELSSERLPMPGDTCQVLWLHHNENASAYVIMPPPLILHAISDDTITVVDSNPIVLDWFELGSEYEYVLELECLESVKVPIDGQIGNFANTYDGPQVGATLNLPIDRFTYYGTHRLVIYALNPNVIDVFFFDPSDIRGLLQASPDNVTNGKGLVAATTRLEILLEVQ